MESLALYFTVVVMSPTGEESVLAVSGRLRLLLGIVSGKTKGSFAVLRESDELSGAGTGEMSWAWVRILRNSINKKM